VSEKSKPLPAARRSVEVRVPASTANLGAGFDSFGLALELYLTVRASVGLDSAQPCRIRSSGESPSSLIPRAADRNLIFRAMSHAAKSEGVKLPPLRLAVKTEIPLSSGLGSSASAIIAGISLCSLVTERPIPDEVALRYATTLEGHADNAAASLYGGFVVTCGREDGSVLAIKKRWPPEIRVIIVTPHVALETAHARAILPDTISRGDAVHNLQRAALFVAALEEGHYDLLWEAMQDRLHQGHRGRLVPGLADALATPQLPGLLGIALSGSGPSVIALARDSLEQIGNAIAANFRRHGIETTVRYLKVSQEGRQTKERGSRMLRRVRK
jgi:homoserine kinase